MMESPANRLEVFKPKPGLRQGYGTIRCPNPQCSYVLFEVSKRFWNTNHVEKMLCAKCEHPASLIACIQPEHEAGELIIRYWCQKCGVSFERTMAGIREYCRGCKTYQNIYFTLSMALPPYGGDFPEIKLAA